MNKNREYELKILINGVEYKKLDQKYIGTKFVQTNFYFDTPEFDVYRSKRVIRIRKKAESYEITVKTGNFQSNSMGIVDMNENTITIDEFEARMILDGRYSIGMYLSSFEDLSGLDLSLIGNVETTRKLIKINPELPYAELDMSKYNSIVDYELEWEIDESEYSRALQYLKDIDISIKNHESGIPKYKRFITSLKKG